MNEQEARARCADLAVSSPDRDTHSWIPKRQSDGTWAVIKLAVPSPKSPEGVRTVSAKDEGAKDDPRTPMEQNFPPYGIGI